MAGLIQWGLRWTNVPGATICAVVVVPGMTTRHLRGTCSNTGCNSALRKALNQGGCPCTLSLRASGWGPPSIGDATHIKNWGLVRVLVLVNNKISRDVKGLFLGDKFALDQVSPRSAIVPLQLVGELLRKRGVVSWVVSWAYWAIWAKVL